MIWLASLSVGARNLSVLPAVKFLRRPRRPLEGTARLRAVSCHLDAVHACRKTWTRRGIRLCMSSRRILVTAALPYANGPIHLGHLVEYIQTDIWVRFQKLVGNRCVYVCADDTHGTAIMISAKKAGVSEEQFIARMNEEHQCDFAGFQIEFDNYGSTHC